MIDETPPRSLGPGRAPLPAETLGAPPAPFGTESYLPTYEAEAGGLDLRRFLVALLRFKWLLIVGALVGVAGALVALRVVPVTYAAQGNLWIEPVNSRDNQSDVTPLRTSSLLEAGAWIELLRSYRVLDSVVVEQGLYVDAPNAYSEVFESLKLAERFAWGNFDLSVAEDGESFTLATIDGVLWDQGKLGEPIGEELGYVWQPPAGAFPAGEVVRFSVLTPRDAALRLSEDLVTSMDMGGAFLRLSLEGVNPRRISGILNSIMDRHVALAAQLKRAKLDETQVILEEQLRYTELELAQAERDLEEFRITTISLPTDRTAIAAGLQVTRDPVFDNFFDLRVQLEQIRRDHDRLREVLADFQGSGDVRIEALEVIPAAVASSELRRILDELVNARSELRSLLDHYSTDYPPVQSVLGQIETIESEALPRVVGRIISELQQQEAILQGRIDSASAELRAIPPRTIEEGRLARRVEITENLYNELRGRVETARLAAASSIPDVRILDRAQIPQQPTGDWRLIIAAGILFGCFGVALGGAVVLDRVDARFRYASDVSKDIGLDILGSIPRIEAGSGRKGILNAAAALEAFRELRIHIGFAHGAAGPITLTVSSPAAGEGKSLISSNLAVAFAEAGRRTLLIDGDTRRGDSHKLFGRAQSPGLVDYLKERSGQEIIQKTDHDNLDFIGCGSRGTTTPELLASPRMAYFVGTLKRSYDVIIVDSPPLAAGGDAVILATLTGNLAVVIRTGTTEKQLAMAKLDQLSRLPIRILGAILNAVDPSDAYHYYYSSYLPGYEPVPESEDEVGVQLISDTKA